MGPQNKRKGGDEQEHKAIFVDQKPPGLKYPNNATYNSEDDDSFHQLVRLAGNVVVQAATHQDDQRDERQDDGDEDQDERDRFEEYVGRSLFFGEIGANQGASDASQYQQNRY